MIAYFAEHWRVLLAVGLPTYAAAMWLALEFMRGSTVPRHTCLWWLGCDAEAELASGLCEYHAGADAVDYLRHRRRVS